MNYAFDRVAFGVGDQATAETAGGPKESAGEAFLISFHRKWAGQLGIFPSKSAEFHLRAPPQEASLRPQQEDGDGSGVQCGTASYWGDISGAWTVPDRQWYDSGRCDGVGY